MVRDFVDWCHRAEERSGTAPPYEAPQFTVIAHSLGGILAFDALTYSHADLTVRERGVAGSADYSSLPFPGYTYKADAETVSWRHLVEQVATLDPMYVTPAFRAPLDGALQLWNDVAMVRELKASGRAAALLAS